MGPSFVLHLLKLGAANPQTRSDVCPLIKPLRACTLPKGSMHRLTPELMLYILSSGPFRNCGGIRTRAPPLVSAVCCASTPSQSTPPVDSPSGCGIERLSKPLYQPEPCMGFEPNPPARFGSQFYLPTQGQCAIHYTSWLARFAPGSVDSLHHLLL